MNTAKIAAAAARLFAWAKRRAAEKSTWLGLAGVAGALGYSTLDLKLTALADALPISVAGGAMALAAASTLPRAPVVQPLRGESAPTSAGSSTRAKSLLDRLSRHRLLSELAGFPARLARAFQRRLRAIDRRLNVT